MAISQRLVDPRKEKVSTYKWQASYQAAVLETDWTKMEERLQKAVSEIHNRRLALSQDHSGTAEEREALADAMSSLQSLRKDVAEWLERQKSC
jgi:conjugal transfer/entry exclusion protein